MNALDLLDRISRYGVARCEAELAQLARMAGRLGVATAIASVLIDRDAPAVVRERAAARTAAAIARVPRAIAAAA